jgi:hydroxymethylpyrimidine pyrophosphatase-like HAD family hydrolase/energy-coupling factor transporter ATP-binding protein EcfA2
MRYHALATDYDLTIAENGVVSETTIRAIERLRNSGRLVILVTGRLLEDLLRVFPRIDLFDRVVAENGALLYRPATREERLLSEPPPPEFIQALSDAGIFPLEKGKVIVATLRPHETEVFEIIRDMGLELHVIFNHTAVMILPSGVNKASGLKAALLELGLSPHNCVGVGDAENDHAFLAVTGCSAAVCNALDALKKRVDYVATGVAGDGVSELIGHMVESDLQSTNTALKHRFAFGTQLDGTEVSIDTYGNSILITGPAGSGKSTLAHTFLEKLNELGYQFCIIDPQGEYFHMESAVLGEREHPPAVAEVIELLAKPSQNVTVNLRGIPSKERPAFMESLLHRLQELRSRTGRPHWLIVDEAHHVLPPSWKFPDSRSPEGGMGVLMITVEPDKLPQEALQLLDLVIAVGENPDRTLEALCNAVGQQPPAASQVNLETGEALGWFRKTSDKPLWFRALPAKSERHRQRRKYAEGELAPELSFYFRGADKKLNLRAQNLSVFMQMADGVDDETWLFHLREGEISRWLRDVIKDPELAAEVQKLETPEAPAGSSRAHIRSEIEKRYMKVA